MIALLKKQQQNKTKQKTKNKTQRRFANQVERNFETQFREFFESSFFLNISDFSIQCSGMNKQTDKQKLTTCRRRP